ncbi:hypothetical protein GCM10011487_56510 [Steroidobacter agaridevorans]|uniref:Uncharacterized protein n=2 Tax=Steroidobacter agaridevorans TaxID=2695856 RepID=A0A829YLA7_9GAMM|nr:hypothetical protein GCM10011487_56510 [Steroidobacter agaridevorans]
MASGGWQEHKLTMRISQQIEKPRCAAILIGSGRNNQRRGMAPGERIFVDRLIAHGDELGAVYEEIDRKLQAHPSAIHCLLASIVRAAVLCSEFGVLRGKTSRSPDALSVKGRGVSGSFAQALRADFGKAMFAVIELNSMRNGGVLPVGFMLSDAAVGTLAKYVLETTLPVA